jgi:xyloglucan-specific exo-beta-1,4-glucanase
MGKGMFAVADRVNPDKFYSFDRATGKFYESFDKGHVFQERQVPVSAKGEQFVIAPAPGIEGDIWLIGAETLYHSKDSGVTFTRSENVDHAYTLGFGKPAPGKTYPALYLVARQDKTDGIYRSDDAGQQWVRINDDQHQYGWIGSVTGDPRVYGRVYVATGGRGIIYGDIAQPAAGAKTETSN